MIEENITYPILLIIGPTAVGKTNLAAAVAERICGVIVSADSRQIFRGMNIGTDKPVHELLEKIPHYMIDIKQPDEYFSAGQYAREARKILYSIIKKGKQVIIAGGSGLYIRVLLDGIFDEPSKDLAIKKSLIERAKREGTHSLYEQLEEIDSVAAHNLDTRDTQRIIRALEVYLTTGRLFSEFIKEKTKPLNLPVIMIGLTRNREELYARIEERVDKMLERGLVSEVEQLRAQGYGRNLNSMQSVGYREVHSYLDGEITYQRMVELIKQRSRNYAKRQYTWFKKDKRVIWVESRHTEADDLLIEKVLHILKENSPLRFKQRQLLT